MINVKDHKTGYLFDPWEFLGPKRRKLMDESWAGLFREKILCELPVPQFAKAFSEIYGRPTKELYAILGGIILQQMHDLSDEETVNQFAFNLQWHYALDIVSTSEKEAYLCPRTLWGMRSIVMEKGLDRVLFDKVAEVLAAAFDVDTDKQRLDSVHIRSNMRRLGRIGIFVETINKFLVNLKRQHGALYAEVPQELREKYMSEKALAAFSLVKPSLADNTLKSLSEDLCMLGQRFSDNPEVCAMSSYRLLLRVLEEHCVITLSDDDQTKVSVKPAKEVPSDSLQSPSDPDATYDGHKGQGYQVQVLETYSREKVETTLNLITYVEVEPAHISDTHAVIPALESVQARDLGPKEVLADSLYGSDDNEAKARGMGVEIIAPTMGGPRGDSFGLADFSVDAAGDITACPAGHAPVSQKTKRVRHIACFSLEICNACPHRSQCPVQTGKKYAYLRINQKTRRIAERRRAEQTPEFIDKYRFRAGIEATMSEYNTRTGVKRLRYRGLKAVRFAAMLKAAGLNIFRAATVRRALASPSTGFSSRISSMMRWLFTFIGNLRRLGAVLKDFVNPRIQAVTLKPAFPF